MVTGKHLVIERPFFTFFMHHGCPVCMKTLEVIQAKKVVISGSDEAKDYNFSTVDGAIIGDIEVTHNLFYCSFCSRVFSIQDIFDAELIKKDAIKRVKKAQKLHKKQEKGNRTA